MAGTFKSRRKKRNPDGSGQTDAEFVASVRAQAQGSYREQSLRIHGWVCAKCGREFELSNLHLLTVHHKDGNHQNNPPDGRNWENLCAYCHEDEHARELLATQTARAREDASIANGEDAEQRVVSSGGLGTLGEILASKIKTKPHA